VPFERLSDHKVHCLLIRALKLQDTLDAIQPAAWEEKYVPYCCCSKYIHHGIRLSDDGSTAVDQTLIVIAGTGW
jgi:hypothetical protein